MCGWQWPPYTTTKPEGGRSEMSPIPAGIKQTFCHCWHCQVMLFPQKVAGPRDALHCRADAAALVLLLNHSNPTSQQEKSPLLGGGDTRICLSQRQLRGEGGVTARGINGDFTQPWRRKFSKQTIHLERLPWQRSNITTHVFLCTPFLHHCPIFLHPHFIGLPCNTSATTSLA